MDGLQKKSFETPDETRTFDKGKFEVIKIGKYTIGKATFEPGWKWSVSVKPIVKTESCESAHFIYVISGQMKTVMNDGQEIDVRPGDVVNVPPGHDAWTLGDETLIFLDFSAAETYAK